MKATFEGVLFYLGLGLLFSHELDAIVQAEWRLLYVVRSMADEQAMPIFIALHVPLFAFIVWLTHHNSSTVQLRSRIVFNAFLVIHAGLHFRLSNDPLYTFNSFLSQGLIFGAAICGALALVSNLFTRSHDALYNVKAFLSDKS
ncbi:MAG: hypothetical protein HC939_09370 [Pleurocapsa sp. SU_5_0]|nr:hypothetical protein [Pleurocapsa sp. SU_5_0]NJR45430.1 hypothetical protein [Hyellaceae cyanobacterium CSU_1_1]